MKKIILIGNRLSCLKSLENNPNYEIVQYYADKDSLLENYLKQKDIPYVSFDKEDKELVFQQLQDLDYDILVSNGCPLILPASKLEAQGKMLLNTHPTYLPYLRGATPLNGVFYKGYNFVGATTHYISDRIDAGNIVYQEKVEITDDIDQGLVYYISFYLEEVVFKKALELLEASNFQFKGTPLDTKQGCYFNRTKEKQTLDFVNDDIETCIRKIKSFGISSQGCFVTIEDKSFKVFSCEKVDNPFLLKVFETTPIGKVALKYDNKFIIKVKDGLLKITKYEEIHRRDIRAVGSHDLCQ